MKGVTYRFRVVAIYSNNDNRHGPSSKRITVGSATDHWTKVLVPGPIIVEARPLSASEIFIGWQVRCCYHAMAFCCVCDCLSVCLSVLQKENGLSYQHQSR